MSEDKAQDELTIRLLTEAKQHKERSISDRVEQLAKIFSLVFIPIALAVLTSTIQSRDKDKSLAQEYVKLSVDVLRSQDTEKWPELRGWAISTINEYAKVKMTYEQYKILKFGGASLPSEAVLAPVKQGGPIEVTTEKQPTTISPGLAFSLGGPIGNSGGIHLEGKLIRGDNGLNSPSIVLEIFNPTDVPEGRYQRIPVPLSGDSFEIQTGGGSNFSRLFAEGIVRVIVYLIDERDGMSQIIQQYKFPDR